MNSPPDTLSMGTESEKSNAKENRDHDHSSQATQDRESDPSEIPTAKTSVFGKVWSDLGLDVPTLMLMAKFVNFCRMSLDGPNERQGSMSASHSYCNVGVSIPFFIASSETILGIKPRPLQIRSLPSGISWQSCPSSHCPSFHGQSSFKTWSSIRYVSQSIEIQVF